MAVNIDEFVRNIVRRQEFSADYYLKTTHFVIFLLFGCDEEIKNTLEERANEMIADKKTVVFLSADKGRDIAADVKNARKVVSDSGAELPNMNELHFCPLVISDAANYELFEHTVSVLEAYRKANQYTIVWKPFIILNVEEPSALDWLASMNRTVKSLGETKRCRCCVMTWENEDGFKVSDARLFDTILFIALLHANANANAGISQLIAYQHNDPETVFYTAQTASISNPVVVRTLLCMNMLMKRIDAKSGEESDLNPDFVNNTLEGYFEKLPSKNRMISFVPLYGVMPEQDGNEALFQVRLDNFSNTYYGSVFTDNKDDIFKKFRSGFLHSFARSGKSIDYLREINVNHNEIEKISRRVAPPYQKSSMPSLSRKSGMTKNNAKVYEIIEKKWSNDLRDCAKNLLEEFFRSEYFKSLPGLYTRAQRDLEEVANSFEGEAIRQGRYGAEIYLDLIGDKDERLVNDKAKELSAQSVYPRCISDIVLALETGDEGKKDDSLLKMIETLFDSISGLAGGNGALQYMDWLSDICQDNKGENAKKCVSTINGKLKFPIRLDISNISKSTIVWGNKENNFCSAWEKLRKTQNEFLPVNSKERFVLLTISSAFAQGAIKGITHAQSSLLDSGVSINFIKSLDVDEQPKTDTLVEDNDSLNHDSYALL